MVGFPKLFHTVVHPDSGTLGHQHPRLPAKIFLKGRRGNITGFVASIRNLRVKPSLSGAVQPDNQRYRPAYLLRLKIAEFKSSFLLRLLLLPPLKLRADFSDAFVKNKPGFFRFSAQSMQKRNSVCIIYETVLQNVALYPPAKRLLGQFNGSQVGNCLPISKRVTGINRQRLLISFADTLLTRYKAL